jgi:hypothetical protein
MTEMDQYFRDLLEGVKDAAQHLVVASNEIQAAGNALVRVGENAIHASREHEDLRDTVARLETMVVDVLREVRELRSERDGH